MEERVLTVHVHDDSADGLWAEVVELPGCFASGRALSELQAALREAVELYLSTPDHEAVVEIKGWEQVDDADLVTVLLPA